MSIYSSLIPVWEEKSVFAALFYFAGLREIEMAQTQWRGSVCGRGGPSVCEIQISQRGRRRHNQNRLARESFLSI